jgi:hypothetical protein
MSLRKLVINDEIELQNPTAQKLQKKFTMAGYQGYVNITHKHYITCPGAAPVILIDSNLSIN